MSREAIYTNEIKQKLEFLLELSGTDKTKYFSLEVENEV